MGFPPCICTLNRDQGFVNPYDISYGDRIYQRNAACPVHGAESKEA